MLSIAYVPPPEGEGWGRSAAASLLFAVAVETISLAPLSVPPLLSAVRTSQSAVAGNCLSPTVSPEKRYRSRLWASREFAMTTRDDVTFFSGMYRSA